jgi:hypothetical protein
MGGHQLYMTQIVVALLFFEMDLLLYGTASTPNAATDGTLTPGCGL